MQHLEVAIATQSQIINWC